MSLQICNLDLKSTARTAHLSFQSLLHITIRIKENNNSEKREQIFPNNVKQSKILNRKTIHNLRDNKVTDGHTETQREREREGESNKLPLGLLLQREARLKSCGPCRVYVSVESLSSRKLQRCCGNSGPGRHGLSG